MVVWLSWVSGTLTTSDALVMLFSMWPGSAPEKEAWLSLILKPVTATPSELSVSFLQNLELLMGLWEQVR